MENAYGEVRRLLISLIGSCRLLLDRMHAEIGLTRFDSWRDWLHVRTYKMDTQGEEKSK